MKPLVNSRSIYFDCNATTFVLPSAEKAAIDAMQAIYGNPSSTHQEGLRAKEILDSTRKLAAQVLGTEDPDQIIFTSGATEAIQTAVFSALVHLSTQPKSNKNKILYGATEHKAVSESIKYWVKILRLPFEVVELQVEKDGQINLSQLEKQIPHTAFLCTMAVNNETGAIQDLKAIENLLNKNKSDALWLVDGVQALGKMDFSLKDSRINYVSISGHKIYALKGIGFLYVKKDSPFSPIIVGGGQERGLRSGTENVPGVASLSAVLSEILLAKNPQTANQSQFLPTKRLFEYRAMLVASLKKAFPKIVFNTPLENAVPTTLNFSVPAIASLELTGLFDAAGIRVSAGSACSSGSVKTSHVLNAMGIEEWRSGSAVRLSFGMHTALEEIKTGCELIEKCSEVFYKNLSSEFNDGVVQLRSGASNSWIITDKKSHSCIIIDPCEPVLSRIENYVKRHELTVVGIIDTHGHGDHTSIRPTLEITLSAHLRKGEKGKTDDLGWPEKSSFLTEVTLENKETVAALKLGDDGLVLAKLFTPGHTVDSHALLLGIAGSKQLKAKNISYVFCGDTILSGGLGRTDFPVSDPALLYSSLQKMEKVFDMDSSLLCPAHDYDSSFGTSLQIEKTGNELLKNTLKAVLSLKDFVTQKKKTDEALPSLEKDFQGVMCGVTTKCRENDLFSIKPKDINVTPDTVVIDVRESYEFFFDTDWEFLGLNKPPQNIPLSRTVMLLSELLHKKNPQTKVICICQSGARGLAVVKSLRRMGFANSWNVQGGIALHLNHG